MTQIIVINDTGAQIESPTTITLDGVNRVPPIESINSGALVMMGSAATSLATSTVLESTATAPAGDLGNYVYLESENEIKLGVDMEMYHMLVLDVVLVNELVRT